MARRPARSVLKALLKLGLLDREVEEELATVEAFQQRRVPPGEAMDRDELMAMAEITPEDIARARADWVTTAPDWAKGLLETEEAE